MTESQIQTCSSCGRDRTLDDAYDYNPIQALTGRPLGWYSGDDGEVCPQCMTAMMRGEPLPPRVATPTTAEHPGEGS